MTVIKQRMLSKTNFYKLQLALYIRKKKTKLEMNELVLRQRRTIVNVQYGKKEWGRRKMETQAVDCCLPSRNNLRY